MGNLDTLKVELDTLATQLQNIINEQDEGFLEKAEAHGEIVKKVPGLMEKFKDIIQNMKNTSPSEMAEVDDIIRSFDKVSTKVAECGNVLKDMANRIRYGNSAPPKIS